MEGSISGELYSEIMKNSTTASDTSAKVLCDASGDEDDLWYDDESAHECAPEGSSKASDLDREWLRRCSQLHNIGYRDGLMAGKEASAQEGFNIGFKESVLVGRNFGFVRGVTSALACLPSGIREKLVETEDRRMKLKHLHESVHSLSSTDALKLFHDRLANREANSGKAETNDHMVNMESGHFSRKALEAYHEELQALILESPAIRLHLGTEDSTTS